MSESGVSFDDFLEALAQEVGDSFDTVDLIDYDSGRSLFVHNDGGSAILGIKPESAGAANLIRIRSVVVNSIDDDAGGKAVVEVNELNASSHIGRWFYRPDLGMIIFEADQVILTDQAYGEEEAAVFRAMLLTAYETVDNLDDQVLANIGSGQLAKQPPPLDWGP